VMMGIFLSIVYTRGMSRTFYSKGFTLIEILLSVFICSLLIGAVGLFQSSVFTNERFARTRIMAIEDGRTTLRRFLEETRNISYAHDGAYPIALATTSAFTFYADIDGDALKERVRYYLATSSLGVYLKKAVLKPTGSPLGYTGTEKVTTLVSNMKNATQPLFYYYDTAENLITGVINPSLIRSVTLSLVIGVSGSSTASVSLQNRSTFRNLKDNY
jgi:prepilin-type N-terminal cleavage/methylation domain-containing protein